MWVPRYERNMEVSRKVYKDKLNIAIRIHLHIKKKKLMHSRQVVITMLQWEKECNVNIPCE
jgi:hypothetical protein